MKKKILYAVFVISAICMNAFAAADVSVVNNKVTVEVDAEAGKWGTLIITKSGESLDNENIIAMKQAIADENGKAIFNFSMPDTLVGGVNGKYDLHIKNGDKNVYVESIYYASPEDRENVIERLKNDTNVKSVIENNEETLKALSVYLDIYKNFKEIDIQNGNTELTDSACEAFTDARTAGMSDTEIINLLNKTLIIQAINVLPDKNVEIIEKLRFAFENVEYKNAEASVKNFVCEYIYTNKPYANLAEVEKAYKIANMLNVINNTRFNNMESKITGYAQDLGITSTTEYLNYLNVSDKTPVNVDIVDALKGKSAVTVQELLLVIDTATKNNTSQTGAGSGLGGGSLGGGSSGGGGFGGSSGGEVKPLPIVPTSNDSKFDDIGGVPWASAAILSMAEKGIIAGDGKGKFNPDNSVKREEFVKMLVMAAGMYNTDAKCAFDDVKDNVWYSSYVASAYNNKLVNGISGNNFGVGVNISRQDMAVMCCRAAQNLNILKKVRDSVQFADAENIDAYAKDAVNALYEAGAINGIGNDLFDPAGTATRAQAAVIIYNLFVR